MITTKLSADKKVPIIFKVSVKDTLKGIPHGEEVHFARTDLSVRDTTVRVSILRLNREAKREEYAMRLDEDGSYWIRRK